MKSLLHDETLLKRWKVLSSADSLTFLHRAYRPNLPRFEKILDCIPLFRTSFFFLIQYYEISGFGDAQINHCGFVMDYKTDIQPRRVSVIANPIFRKKRTQKYEEKKLRFTTKNCQYSQLCSLSQSGTYSLEFSDNWEQDKNNYYFNYKRRNPNQTLVTFSGFDYQHNTILEVYLFKKNEPGMAKCVRRTKLPGGGEEILSLVEYGNQGLFVLQNMRRGQRKIHSVDLTKPTTNEIILSTIDLDSSPYSGRLMYLPFNDLLFILQEEYNFKEQSEIMCIDDDEKIMGFRDHLANHFGFVCDFYVNTKKEEDIECLIISEVDRSHEVGIYKIDFETSHLIKFRTFGISDSQKNYHDGFSENGYPTSVLSTPKTLFVMDGAQRSVQLFNIYHQTRFGFFRVPIINDNTKEKKKSANLKKMLWTNKKKKDGFLFLSDGFVHVVLVVNRRVQSRRAKGYLVEDSSERISFLMERVDEYFQKIIRFRNNLELRVEYSLLL